MRCSLYLLFLLTFYDTTDASQPNIIFILADDLGWDDVSFHGSTQIFTPNLDELAKTGVILNNYYVSPICTPTRSAIMTGKYPIHTGMQHSVILAPQPYGLGLNETLLPQRLKELGYATHGVGKWHLGFYKLAYTPVHRGFDSFFGIWSGKGDYWNHTNLAGQEWGLDLHDGDHNVWTELGNYSTSLYTNKAVNIIQDHDTAKPLFLYLAHQAVHSANPFQPLQAPQDFIDEFSHIKDPHRRTYAAMVAALDQSVKQVVDALKAKNIYNNTIIIFTTDNGGAADGFDLNYGSNYPLRGMKNTLWEGGIRGAAFVHSPLIKSPGRVSGKMLHICDWLPTLYVRAGGQIEDLNNLDGYDVWNSITLDEDSPRTDILHNIDPVLGAAAYRRGNWKVVVNHTMAWSGWYPPPERGQNPKLASPNNAIVTCPKPPSTPVQCTAKHGPCLFDISADPCEYVNQAAIKPSILERMLILLEKYKKGMVPIRNKNAADPNSYPAKNGGAWTTWQD